MSQLKTQIDMFIWIQTFWRIDL